MKKIYFLRVLSHTNEYKHFEDVYMNKKEAIEAGKKWLEETFKEEYKDLFEDGKEIPDLTYEQLFNLKAIYDFDIQEFDPEYVDSLNNIENLQELKEWRPSDTFPANIQPAKIEYSYDYNGKPTYVSGIFIFKYKGKIKEYRIMMHYEDYKNEMAGIKFKVGDIVKIKDSNYVYSNCLHVITEVPEKTEGQDFFRNNYDVVTSHNYYDEGCHVDTFNENDLELYTEDLPYDSPTVFLSKYFKGEIELKNVRWIDIECGRITLNTNPSFRDIPEIIEQMKGEKNG